jgi:class 3 adenylate cyclase
MDALKNRQKKWASNSAINKRWIIGTLIVWSGLLISVFDSNMRHYWDSKISQPLQFKFRAMIGKEPPIDPRIKVYGVDDKAFERLDTWVLTIDQWAAVFQAIALKEPKAILVDAMFSKIVGDQAKVDAALETIGGIKVPITVGSFTTPKKLKYRIPLDQSKPGYNLKSLLRNPEDSLDKHVPSLVRANQWYLYGPAPQLSKVIPNVGHLHYNIPGRVAAFVRTSDEIAIPYMSFFSSDSMFFENRKLYINDNQVPLDRSGYLIPNFRKDNGPILSMYPIIYKALRGKRIESIRKGDIVYIIPHYYTGHTDFAATPFGNRPGGLIHLAVMDSILTGRWLKPIAAGEIIIVLMVLFGILTGAKLSAGKFFPAFIGILFVYLSSALYMFAEFSLLVPWLFPMLGFAGSALTIYGRKVQQNEKKAQFLKHAFEGSVAENDLKKLLKNPEDISFEARERVVTLAFVDVVGFSKMAESMLPRMAFDNLKNMLAKIGDMIHEHGGIIDRTLGDGLLAYFGYRFDQDQSTPDHAEQALRCMIEIQEWNLACNIEAAKQGEQVYPLRIGINTASCYLGNLGSTNRIDFTVVGNGVNFAKRLEGACEMHSVLMGSTTNDLIKGIGIDSRAVTKRFIRIKHHSELVESYEYDPFYDKPDQRYAALEAFRKCANIERIDQRWPVSDPTKIQLHTDFGPGELINFSHTGFSIRLNQLLTRGTTFNITLDAAGGALKSLLAKEGIEVMHGEVRWGYDDGNGFVHGVMVNDLADSQSDFLVQYLCEFAFSSGAHNNQDESKAS